LGPPSTSMCSRFEVNSKFRPPPLSLARPNIRIKKGYQAEIRTGLVPHQRLHGSKFPYSAGHLTILGHQDRGNMHAHGCIRPSQGQMRESWTINALVATTRRPAGMLDFAAQPAMARAGRTTKPST
jgi:hypothetical protein